MELADAELVADFAVESQEGLANIEQQMLAIEAAGADIDVDLVNAVFRTMHSIKGTAGFLGLDRIGKLAHGLEEVLNHMRNREIVPSSELVTTVLSAADYMKALIDAVESSNDADITEYVTALQQYRPGAAPVAAAISVATPAPVAPSAPAAIATPASEAKPTAATSPPAAITEAVREFLVECHENLDQMEQHLLGLEQAANAADLLRGIFRTMHTIKGGAGFLGLRSLEQLAHTAENLLGRLRDGKLPVSAPICGILLSTVDKCREGLRLLETQGTDDGFQIDALVAQLIEVEQANPAATSTPTAKVASPTVPPVAPLARAPAAVSTVPVAPAATKSPAVVEPPPAAADKTSAPVSESTIRVDVGLLDKLMTRVGELVLARNQIIQFTGKLQDAGFINTAQRLNLITTELQESVMKTRMQPIGNVWSKFPRVVRDLSGQLGKQVRIEMEGKETELDKTIVEAIKDPLTHLVRNSVDHGIESPEKRAASGKPAEGVLLLRAYHEGGQVNIEITDDGAGLNLDRIRKKAIERGLLTPEQAARLPDRDAAQLIFAPGFSTAENVTSVSGRGVGMDVVKTNIERISGTIDLQSRPGAGTTVRIKIPLTLAIVPALIVVNDGDRYAIPQVSLLELVRLDAEKARSGIEYVHGAPVYRLRGKLLPLVYLSQCLGLKTKKNAQHSETETADSTNIVVLRADDRQFGLVVDKVNDTEEIVVKPLGKQLKGISEYAGATIMGDGSVALILDVKGLALAAGLGSEERSRSTGEENGEQARRGSNKETMLVVDVGDARRFALPTSLVARLEKIPAAAVEQGDRREVIQYRDTILPLVRLADVVQAPRGEETDQELQVVVYDEPGQSFGLVVGRIVDICDVEPQLEAAASADDYLLGSMVIQQRVTDVLDLRRLNRRGRDNSTSTSREYAV